MRRAAAFTIRPAVAHQPKPMQPPRAVPQRPRRHITEQPLKLGLGYHPVLAKNGEQTLIARAKRGRGRGRTTTSRDDTSRATSRPRHQNTPPQEKDRTQRRDRESGAPDHPQTAQQDRQNNSHHLACRTQATGNPPPISKPQPERPAGPAQRRPARRRASTPKRPAAMTISRQLSRLRWL